MAIRPKATSKRTASLALAVLIGLPALLLSPAAMANAEEPAGTVAVESPVPTQESAPIELEAVLPAAESEEPVDDVELVEPVEPGEGGNEEDNEAEPVGREEPAETPVGLEPIGPVQPPVVDPEIPTDLPLPGPCVIGYPSPCNGPCLQGEYWERSYGECISDVHPAVCIAYVCPPAEAPTTPVRMELAAGTQLADTGVEDQTYTLAAAAGLILTGAAAVLAARRGRRSATCTTNNAGQEAAEGP